MSVGQRDRQVRTAGEDRQTDRQVRRQMLTGHSHVSVCFPFVNHVHHFIRTGDKSLRTTLEPRKRTSTTISTSTCNSTISESLVPELRQYQCQEVLVLQ